jgi:hypothetical protein
LPTLHHRQRGRTVPLPRRAHTPPPVRALEGTLPERTAGMTVDRAHGICTGSTKAGGEDFLDSSRGRTARAPASGPRAARDSCPNSNSEDSL